MKFSTYIKSITLTEKELSPLQKEYQEYFAAKLSEYGVDSPVELSDEKMAEFFSSITAGWIKGKGKK